MSGESKFADLSVPKLSKLPRPDPFSLFVAHHKALYISIDNSKKEKDVMVVFPFHEM